MDGVDVSDTANGDDDMELEGEEVVETDANAVPVTLDVPVVVGNLVLVLVTVAAEVGDEDAVRLWVPA